MRMGEGEKDGREEESSTTHSPTATAAAAAAAATTTTPLKSVDQQTDDSDILHSPTFIKTAANNILTL